MSQNINFYAVNLLTDKTTEYLEFENIYLVLQAVFNNNLSELNRSIFNTVLNPIEEVESLLLSAYTPGITEILSDGTNTLLHPQSRVYYVTPALWQAIENNFLREVQSSNNLPGESTSKLSWLLSSLEAWTALKKIYEQKKLVLEVH